jgi:hypothetical protein
VTREEGGGRTQPPYQRKHDSQKRMGARVDEKNSDNRTLL